jgi:hypothetical protein
MSVTHLYVVAVAAIFGCASGGSGAPGTYAARRTAGLLTAEEIASTHADVTTAYDAVARLRPNWLAPHGAMTSNSTASNYSTVFVDGQLQGDITALRNIPGYQVAEIRYYDVTQAGGRFGIRAGTTGAIEVSMKKP